MAAIKFIVKSVEKGRLATVYLRFVNGRETNIMVSVPEKVYPEYWSNKTESFKQRILFDQVFTEQEKVNVESGLRDLKNFVLNQFNDLCRTGATPTKEWLNNVIHKHYNHTSPSEENLNQYLERFINEAETGQRLYEHNGKNKRYEKGSLKNFKGFKVQFDNYQAEKKIKLNFNDINIDFYDEFVRYFTNKNYSTNTIGRHIKNLKSIMRCARDEGLHTNTEIDRKKFKALKVQVQNIYLTESEVSEIFDLDLSRNKTWEVARDIFLIGCYTAQRFSDYSNIKPSNIKDINGVKVIDLIQQKTGERVIIPIKPELDFLLKKYDYHVPKTWEQKVNSHIKDVCEMAKITEPIEIEEIKGGLKIKRTVPKNKLVKTHTSRRTGCTLMYLSGVRPIDIMKISGHRTEREFMNYIKVEKEETATSLSKHPYFMATLKIAK